MTTDPPEDSPPVLTEGDDAPVRHLPVWQESVLLLVLALVLAVLVKTFLVQAFYIPSASMEPGLRTGDRIVVEKPSYWFGGSPSRGDVVVFADPGGWLTPDEEDQTTGVSRLLSKVGLFPAGGHLVKRVIGVGGDTVTCCDGQGRVMVNGYPLDEGSYVAARAGGDGSPACNGPMTGNCDWTSGVIPRGDVFVMGDNRAHSADSTVHLCSANETDCTDSPYVPDSLVVGKVLAVVWPVGHLDLVGTPDDFSHVPAPAAAARQAPS